LLRPLRDGRQHLLERGTEALAPSGVVALVPGDGGEVLFERLAVEGDVHPWPRSSRAADRTSLTRSRTRASGTPGERSAERRAISWRQAVLHASASTDSPGSRADSSSAVTSSHSSRERSAASDRICWTRVEPAMTSSI